VELSALRTIRAIEASDRATLARSMLEVVASATSSTRATLRLSDGTTFDVGAEPPLDAERLELQLRQRVGVVVLTLERSTPFDSNAELQAEVLGGEIALRLEHAAAEERASRATRQVELLGALSRASAEALRLSEIADSVAREILGAFAGASVIVHITVDDHLELVARWGDEKKDLDSAPNWLRRVPLDGPTIIAIAAREKRLATRAVRDVIPERRAPLEAAGLAHLAVAPLLFDDRVFGTITVGHSREAPWDVESLRLLQSAAVQLGVQFAHVRMLEVERRRADDLRIVNELGSLIAQHLDLPGVLTTAVTQLARVTGISRVHLLLVDAAKTALETVASSEDIGGAVVMSVTSNGVAAHAFRTKVPVLAENAATDSRTDKTMIARLGARSIMAVPLISRGEVIGVLVLAESRHPRAFTETDVARVVAVANLLAPAVANAKMFEDLRKSYETLAATQAELITHERLAALGELSAVIAHEVRNPLAIIFNSLGSLQRHESMTPDANLLLDIVGEEAARLNRIVGDLLDFVRPYAAHPRNVCLDAIVKGAVDAARRALPDTTVEVLTDLDFPFNELFVDGTMLQQALINLIVNAVQATPRGKTVMVLASPKDTARGVALRCDVVDEGPGIDAADAARVFQPFFTTKATGTGLGLAVVQRIAIALGGVIEVARAPSGGSRFTLTVPVVVSVAADLAV
jgi:signal transduction histidine kinase